MAFGKEEIALMRTRYAEKIVKAAPEHRRTPETWDTVEGQLSLAMQANPQLRDCDMLSIVYSCYRGVRLGLDISGASGQAYLVPFNNRSKGTKEAQLIVGYKGLVTLACRASGARFFKGIVVWQGEPFEYVDGLHPVLKHNPTFGVDRPSDIPVCAYAVAEWPDGYKAYKVAPGYYLAEIESDALRKAGNRVTPWQTNRGEMLAKTAVRYLCKGLDLSPDIAAAVEYDARMTAHAHDQTKDEEYQRLIAPPEQSRQADIEAALDGEDS